MPGKSDYIDVIKILHGIWTDLPAEGIFQVMTAELQNKYEDERGSKKDGEFRFLINTRMENKQHGRFVTFKLVIPQIQN